jgi:hypothetical protein
VQLLGLESVANNSDMELKYILRAVGDHAKELKFQHGSCDLELVRELCCASYPRLLAGCVVNLS